MKDGRISLYLNYYLGRKEIPVLDENGKQVYYTEGKMKGKPKYHIKHERKKENLNLYLTKNPKGIEKDRNKDILDKAIEIRFEREQELKEGKLGYRLKAKEINFFDFIQTYYDEYTKGDKRMIKAAQKRFADFIALEYPLYKNNISPKKITPEMMEKDSKSSG